MISHCCPLFGSGTPEDNKDWWESQAKKAISLLKFRYFLVFCAWFHQTCFATFLLHSSRSVYCKINSRSIIRRSSTALLKELLAQNTMPKEKIWFCIVREIGETLLLCMLSVRHNRLAPPQSRHSSAPFLNYCTRCSWATVSI